MTAFDNFRGAKTYIASVTQETALNMYEMASRMVELNPWLGEQFKPLPSKAVPRIKHPGTGSTLYCLSGSDKGKHGGNAHLALIDELHEFGATSEVVSALRTSQAAQPNRLLVYASTAGYERQSLCFKEWEYARSVRDNPESDMTYFPAVFEATDEELVDGWDEPEMWKRLNPGFGFTVQQDYLEAECNRAKLHPSDEPVFRSRHLNQWVSHETKFIPMKDWTKCVPAKKTCGSDDLPSEEELRYLPCFMGFDGSSRQDFTAACLLWEWGNKVLIRVYSWLPGRSKIVADPSLNISGFEEDRNCRLHITTNRDRIDYDVIKEAFDEFASTYQIEHVAFDRYGSDELYQHLEERLGLPVMNWNSSVQWMNGPCREFEKLIVEHRLVNMDRNRLLDWQAENVSVTPGPDNTIRPVKPDSTEKRKIDGIYASILAVGIWQKCRDGVGFVPVVSG